MELSEFNALTSDVLSQSRAITFKAIGWENIVNNVENHEPYESGQISDHFDDAFNEVLNPEIFARDRKPERQQKTISLNKHT